MGKPNFVKRIVGELVSPDNINTFSAVGDINNDGLPDIVICGRNGKMVWFENSALEWEKHLIDNVSHMECGGSLYDINGDGYLDIINGSDYMADEIYWWENPGTTGSVWVKG